jgi:predicted MPP superfamily phosphohydrolase
VVATGCLSAIGVFNALQPPRVHEQQIAVRNLPAALQGLRIAVLADIHASPVNDASYVQTIVQRTLATTPDLIVLPGDMVDGDVATSRAHVAPLAALSARYGVWAAPGNHEYYSGYNAWMAEFRRLGLNLLENRMQLLNIKGSKLALSGIGDPVFGRTSPNNADPEVAEGIPPMWMRLPPRPARPAHVSYPAGAPAQVRARQRGQGREPADIGPYPRRADPGHGPLAGGSRQQRFCARRI